MSEEREENEVKAMPETTNVTHEALISRAAAVEMVEQWFAAHIRNSPIARNVPAWNHIHQAIDMLKARLRGF